MPKKTDISLEEVKQDIVEQYLFNRKQLKDLQKLLTKESRLIESKSNGMILNPNWRLYDQLQKVDKKIVGQLTQFQFSEDDINELDSYYD